MKPPDEWVEGDPNTAPMRVPVVGGYPLRDPDHRFEWTRAEFRTWAEGLAKQFGYTATFDGIGGGAFDEKVPYGVWRGPGPQTQVAIFERKDAGANAGGVENGAGAAAAPLHHAHAEAVVWTSAPAVADVEGVLQLA